MPSPNVDSCVVRFDIKEKTPEVVDEEFFFKVVRGMFSQRRKTLLNCVSGSLCISKDVVMQAIERSGLKPSVRPEELKIEDMISFADSLKELM